MFLQSSQNPSKLVLSFSLLLTSQRPRDAHGHRVGRREPFPGCPVQMKLERHGPRAATGRHTESMHRHVSPRVSIEAENNTGQCVDVREAPFSSCPRGRRGGKSSEPALSFEPCFDRTCNLKSARSAIKGPNHSGVRTTTINRHVGPSVAQPTVTEVHLRLQSVPWEFMPNSSLSPQVGRGSDVSARASRAFVGRDGVRQSLSSVLRLFSFWCLW